MKTPMRVFSKPSASSDARVITRSAADRFQLDRFFLNWPRDRRAPGWGAERKRI